MEDLRKKILLDLCVTPGTMIPGVLGVTLLLLSWVGLGGMAAFVGFCCILLGFGVLLTNFVFNLQGISQRAAKQWQQQQQKLRSADLDMLDRRLQKTKTNRDEESLRNLRTLYNSFSKDQASGKLNENIPPLMLQQIDEIFRACIHQLKTSVEIDEQSQKVSGKLKKTLKSQHDQTIENVESGVETLANTINEVRALGLGSDARSLKIIQQRLTSQLEVAKAVDQRVSALDDVDDFETRFAEYE